jgi:membrane-associated PAP2 superfamily phosphatase
MPSNATAAPRHAGRLPTGWHAGPVLLGAPQLVARDPLSYLLLHVLLATAVVGFTAWQLQHGSLDAAITGLFFDASSHSFGWRHSTWLEVLGHQTARALPVLIGGLAVGAGLAGQFVAELRPWRAILLTLGACVVLGPLLINSMRGWTEAHCPVDLQLFGGVVDYAADRFGPFWAETRAEAGHCLPSGHAGGGFALFGLYFAGWAAGRPSWRWKGLGLGLAAGLLFSLVRIVQGEHFASQTVWAAAIDWAVCSVLFMPLLCRRTAAAEPRAVAA